MKDEELLKLLTVLENSFEDYFEEENIQQMSLGYSIIFVYDVWIKNYNMELNNRKNFYDGGIKIGI